MLKVNISHNEQKLYTINQHRSMIHCINYHTLHQLPTDNDFNYLILYIHDSGNPHIVHTHPIHYILHSPHTHIQLLLLHSDEHGFN